jgi:hypothetical protein
MQGGLRRGLDGTSNRALFDAVDECPLTSMSWSPLSEQITPHHAIARTWPSQARRNCVEGIETLTLLPIVVTGFLRPYNRSLS